MTGVSPGRESARDQTGRLKARIAVPALVLLGLLVVANLALWKDVGRLQDDLSGFEERLAANERSADFLKTKTSELELGAFDPGAVGRTVRRSVFRTIASNGNQASVGTSFAMAKRGRRSLLVTNFHVLGGAQDVQLSRGFRRYEGTVVQSEPDADLASIQIDVDVPVLLSASTPARVGDPVVVVGSAQGLGGTLTTGVVSAVDREIDGKEWLQFSAPVNPGNSGGPVVNKRGEVIGVATFKAVSLEAEGLGFAVPLSRLCASLDVC